MTKHGSGGAGSKGSGDKSGGGKGSSMSKEDASRIQSAGARDSSSKTAESHFDQRAQSAADRNENEKRG